LTSTFFSLYYFVFQYIKERVSIFEGAKILLFFIPQTFFEKFFDAFRANLKSSITCTLFKELLFSKAGAKIQTIFEIPKNF